MYQKRTFLKTFAFAGVSLVSGYTSVNSGSGWFMSLFNSKNNSNRVAGIPDQWVDLEGKAVYEYANYILGLNLKNITPRMILAPHFKCRRGTKNCLPPKNTWSKIKPTLKVIDNMVDVIGRPIGSIVSAYRSPKYNRAVGGKSRSYHMQNQAVDVTFTGIKPSHVAKIARKLRDDRNVFAGGVGTYSGFVHIDTRGVNANW
jgi:hypothetical protein